MIRTPPLGSKIGNRNQNDRPVSSSQPQNNVKTNSEIDKFGETYTKMNSETEVACGGCQKETGETDFVQCDECELWYHVKCAGMTIRTYSQIPISQTR